MNQHPGSTMNAARRDEKPWYKQFWPWFIISLPVSSVIVSMTILWLAITNPDRSVLNDADYQNLRNELKAQPGRQPDAGSGFGADASSSPDTKAHKKTGKSATPNTP